MASLDKREAYRRAGKALSDGRPGDALSPLWSLVDRSHLIDDELAGYLRMLAQAYVALGRARAAATVHLFLGETDAAFRLGKDHPTDLARCAIAAGRPRDAARHFESAGLLGHAAIQLEKAEDDRAARVLWERLADDPRLDAELYTQGLVRFNLGRACERLGDHAAARRATVQSMHLLEAAADGFETQGLRERAFDCYQVLLTLGREGAFENLAEGYVNCIRILAEDNLKYYVLQYYEDFQRLALEAQELHAAATLFREAAEFSRRQNLPYERDYRWKAAETHALSAQRTIDEGGSIDLVENAYAAAIDAYNGLGIHSKVCEIYDALAKLPLADKRRERYARLSARLASQPDESGQRVPFPDYLRMDTAYPEIWRLDVIEWEQAGDAAETMAEVLEDDKWADFTRRRALLCRLHQLGHEGAPTAESLEQLATHLGRVEIYASLAPLEHMFDSPSAPVRTAVMRAVKKLFFKRSFVLVRAGLRDPDDGVRREALAAVSALHFPHSFDPLARIYRESSAEVRRAALESIGKINSIDAAEMLIDVLRHGDRDERETVKNLLARSDHPDVGNLLRRAVTHETGAVRQAMEQILHMRR